MAADISFANAQNETKQGVQAEGKPVSEEEFTEGEPVSEEEFTEEEAVSEEESTEEGSTSGDEFVEAESEESTLEEESFPEEGELSEEEPAEADIIPEEEITSGEFLEGESIPQEEKNLEQQEVREDSPKIQEIAEGYDIDFYVIINGEIVKLQHNDITGIATWKDGRTTYYGVSIEDLLLIYEEFGFVKNGENQNPDANSKFVSAYRGKSRIEYGKVYTDTESGKTYVSYNDGQNKQGEAIDVYYLPNGKGVALNLKDSVKKDNSFYSVEVKGEGQDRIRYALTGTVVEEAVADFNPQLSDQTDQIEWTCMGTDDKVIDGIRDSGNQTRFSIGKITQSYVIQRADQTAFDIQFYIYADNEVRKLPADSLK